MTETSEALSLSSSVNLNSPATKRVIVELVSLICLLHRAEQTEALEKVYYLALADLTMGQVAKLAEMVPKETVYWPSPAMLRKMVGIPTREESLEVTAKEALHKVLSSLRLVRSDPRRIEKWLEEATTRNAQGDTIVQTIERFGGGSLEAGMEILLQHPAVLHEREVQNFGLELSAVEKAESRWIQCWKQVN